MVHEAGEFVELRRVAIGLKNRGYLVSFLFAQPGYVNLKPDRGWCRLNGIAAYDPGSRLGPDPKAEKFGALSQHLEDGYLPNSLHRHHDDSPLGMRLLGLALLPALAAIEMAWTKPRLAMRRRKEAKHRPSATWGRHFRFARRLLDRLAPDLLVYGQEFPGSVNSLLTRLAAERNIPTFIIPFALGTTKEMCESLVDNPFHDVDFSLMNRLAARLYPRWVNYYGGKALLRLPGQHVLMIEALRLAPEHPWLPNSSHATRMLVESEAMETYYRRMKFPDAQLRVTGSPCDDSLAAARRAREERKLRICRKLQVNPGKPLLVCAWPTDQFGSRVRPLEFAGYEKLCHAWARALGMVQRTSNYNVVIRPHPVTDPELLAGIVKPYRLCVTDIDTLELVPVSDLFVACVSSTLRWAIACGIPAINYDCYDYGYTDFESAKGVYTVKQYAEFDELLERLTGDEAAWGEAAQAQALSAPHWGMQDGRSMERIFAAIDELARERRAEPRLKG